MRYKYLQHRFVEHIPEQLEPGVLYISMPYATAAHSCCCGCGEEVVTPFTPTDWKMTFDGENVSLRPSIGNWNLPCRSHYVIEQGAVVEVEPWTPDEIQGEYRRDRAAKAEFYGRRSSEQPAIEAEASSSSSSRPPSRWQRAWSCIREKC
jgi:hypothetical protein